jgi:hypothetical protein
MNWKNSVENPFSPANARQYVCDMLWEYKKTGNYDAVENMIEMSKEDPNILKELFKYITDDKTLTLKGDKDNPIRWEIVKNYPTKPNEDKSNV